MSLAAMPKTEYLRIAFAVAREPMAVIDARNGRIIDANAAFVGLFGDDVIAIKGRNIAEYCVALPPFAANGPVTLRRGPDGSDQASGRRYRCGVDEAADWLLVLEMPGTNAIQADVAAYQIDSLTGLPTRDHFDRRLVECIDRVRRQGAPFCAILFLDLDDFKPVNDRFGHAAGDRVLRAVADRLAGGIRPGDLLSRRGGDEFTLLVDGIQHADEARLIAERLVRMSRDPFIVDGKELHVGVSAGIVLVDGTIVDPARLVAAADRAMYEAKKLGTPVLHSGEIE
jgi:diguanylate cyclase (GGDEF)-like protein